MRDDVGRPDAAGAHPTENRADAKHEFLRAERLGEVIVGAERESANAVLFFAARREHEDGHVARRLVRPQLLEHVVARRAGQHEVEHDQRGTLLPSGGQRLGSGGRRDTR